MSYYDLMTYRTASPIGKNSWLGNLHWFFEESETPDRFVFSAIPSFMEEGQLEDSVCGSYDMKRILFGAEFLCEKQSGYTYGADYISSGRYMISMPFTEYGTVIKSGCDIKISTSCHSGRKTNKAPQIELQETAQVTVISDDSYYLAFCHNGKLIRDKSGFLLKKTEENLHICVSFDRDREKAASTAQRLYWEQTEILQNSCEFWKEYLRSCPLYDLKETYRYHNDYLNREEIYEPEDLKIRQLWHYWCVLMDVSYVEFNKFPLYIAPDKPNWKGTWSNDGPECLSILSLTNQKALARQCIVDYITAAINKDGILSWYLHSDGTGCYGKEGDSGINSHGVPEIVHTVDFYIRVTGDKSILNEPAGASFTVYEKLKLYVTKIHEYRDINKDSLIEWVNLWETGWDDKLGVFFEKASIEKWIDVVLSGEKEQIERFYKQNGCPVTSIVEQVYTVWALRSFKNIAVLSDDKKTAEYCSEKSEKMISAVKEKCWSEEDQFYYDIDVNAGTLSKSKNADAFYFLSFEDDPVRQQSLLAHLNNKSEFNLCYVPMASLDSKGFKETGYWSGGHWPREMSYIAFGLTRCGFKEKAKELCIRALMSEKGNTIPEVINPLTGIKSSEPTKLCYTGLNIVSLLDMDGKVEWSK